MTCHATLDRCTCGLDDHPADVAHECADPDPQCGGSWLDHPTDPALILVVKWPGLRGNPLAIAQAAKLGITDPPPGETITEARPHADDAWVRFCARLGLPSTVPFKLVRGPIRYLPGTSDE